MLLIDCGNSALKCRVIDNGQVEDRSFNWHRQDQWSNFIDLLTGRTFDQIHLASVASQHTTDKLQQDIRHYQPTARLTQLFTLPELDGLINAYVDFRQLGVDRWLTLVAGYFNYAQDLMIVDAGSAITLDLLSQQQGHLGGAILPGLQTDLERFKGFFPYLDYAAAEITITDRPGRSTAECVHLLQSQDRLSHLLSLMADWQELLQSPVKILLCGQDGGIIAEGLEGEFELVSDLVFQGMLKQVELQA